MRKVIALLLVLAFLTASFMIAFTAASLIPRTIVVPDQYPTIAAAITNAKNGDTILVKKGTYEGPKNQTIAISKTISVIGEDAEATTINLQPPLVPMRIFTFEYMGYLDAIKIETNSVKISGLTINTPGGVISTQGDGVQIVGNIATTGLTVGGSYTMISENTLSGSISVDGSHNTITQNKADSASCSGSYNIITGNSVKDDKISISGSFNIASENNIEKHEILVTGDNNIIAKNNLTDSGISIERSSNNIVFANRFWGLSLMGFNNTFYANEIAHVGIGGTHGGTADAANNSFYHNNFLESAPELRVYTKSPGPLVWDNGTQGNYWSSYHAADANNDGVGDVPYTVNAAYSYYDGAIREEAIVDCGQDNFPLMAPFDIDSVDLLLPEWANILLSPSPSPTQEPTSTPEPKQPISIPTIWIVAIAALVAVVIVELIIYFFKVKRSKSKEKQ
jgi:hypothetical protein